MKSFLWAFRGIGYCIASQRNMRVHLCFAFYVAVFGFITKITAGQWAAVIICIGAVTALECLNTSIEALCDTLHPERSDGIAHAKDASAGAVLMAAIASAVVGGIIFFQRDKILIVLSLFANKPYTAAAFAVSLVLAVLFIRGGKGNRTISRP